MDNRNDVGFDALLPFPEVLWDAVGVSLDGRQVVTSTPHSGTFIEHPSRMNMKPVNLLPESADTIGFFGRNKDLIALGVHDLLVVIDSYRMEIFDKKIIEPGSLFVSDSGNSPCVGYTDPSGQTKILHDNHYEIDGALNVGSTGEYSVLWSSTVTPVGYRYIGDDSVSMYIRSTAHDSGSTISSTWGMIVHAVWWNPGLKRHETYITTVDSPNVVKRVSSSDDGAVIENVVSMDADVVITDVVTLPSGQPSLVVGMRGTRPVVETIPPAAQSTEMVKKAIMSTATRHTPRMVGSGCYIDWIQTPVTAPQLYVTNYITPEKPPYKVQSGATLPSDTPTVSRVVTMRTKDKQEISYRYISPLIPDDHMVQTTVVIPDYSGSMAAGEFSPTVKLCYDAGFSVAIVPTRTTKNKFTMHDYKLDVLDVALDIKNKKLCKDFTIIGNNEYCEVAVGALQHRSKIFSKAILVNPDDSAIKKVKRKNVSKIRVVDTSEQQTIHSDHTFVHHIVPTGETVDTRTLHEIVDIITSPAQ